MKMKKVWLFTVILMALIIVSGCGESSHHNIIMQNDYTPNTATKVEVGKVSNDTGEKFDVNVEQMLSDALMKRLLDERLLYTGNTEPKLTTNCKIITYEKGNAFKRWLAPGWGATSLTIQCALLESNKVVGSLNAAQSVNVGGAFGSIGAWKKIFADVAKNIVADIKSKVIDVKVSTASAKNSSNQVSSEKPLQKDDDTARLQKLKEMRASGLITEKEYNKKKKEILDAM